jgi:SAM-dependent methyltransferase
MLLRSPSLARQLAPEAARIVRSTFRELAWGDLTIASLVHAARARRAVPDAALGVGWSPEEPVVEALDRYTRRDMVALELGAGAGRLTRHLAPRVGEVVCTDVSPAMLREARDNLAQLANVRTAMTDGYTLREFEDDSFDLVLAAGVLTFFAPNALLAMLDEVARVLRPGGVLIANYTVLDDPEIADYHLGRVRADALERRFYGFVEQAYVFAQLEALHHLTGMDVLEPRSQGEITTRRGRAVIVGGVPATR